MKNNKNIKLHVHTCVYIVYCIDYTHIFLSYCCGISCCSIAAVAGDVIAGGITTGSTELT